MSWNTHSYSLDIADDERVAFSIVLVGNQIAEYALPFNFQLVFAEPHRTTYSGVAVGG